jgi:hypothetical protein
LRSSWGGAEEKGAILVRSLRAACHARNATGPFISESVQVAPDHGSRCKWISGVHIRNTIQIQIQAPAHARTIPKPRAAELDDELQRRVLQAHESTFNAPATHGAEQAPSTHDLVAARQLWLLLVLVLHDQSAPPSMPRLHTPRVRWAGVAPRRTHRIDLSRPTYDCSGCSFRLRINACAPCHLSARHAGPASATNAHRSSRRPQARLRPYPRSCPSPCSPRRR